jgi:hypothetical protein
MAKQIQITIDATDAFAKVGRAFTEALRSLAPLAGRVVAAARVCEDEARRQRIAAFDVDAERARLAEQRRRIYETAERCGINLAGEA